MLSGGAGADVFYYVAWENRHSTIADFGNGNDRLKLYDTAIRDELDLLTLFTTVVDGSAVIQLGENHTLTFQGVEDTTELLGLIEIL